MRGFGSLFGFLIVVALIIEFFWWIVGAIALVVAFYFIRSVVRADRAARLARREILCRNRQPGRTAASLGTGR